jgi:hypothetical protein
MLIIRVKTMKKIKNREKFGKKCFERTKTKNEEYHRDQEHV